MRTKVETKDIFGSTSAVDNQAAASTEVKETKKTAKKATEKKPVKEAAVKKTEDIAAKLSEVKSDLEEKKGEVKAVVEEVKAETAKKKPGRKPAAKTTRKTAAKKTFKKELFFQFDGKQVDEETLVARITEDVKSQNVEIKDLKMYLKPEDNACYYVANGNLAGKVDLY